MDNKQLLIIILTIILAGLIISIGCFYGLNQNKNTANNTNITNTTNNNNTTSVEVEPITSADQPAESQSYSKTQYIGEDGQPISEADYKTQQVYGKSANSQEEWEAQKASLGY